MQQGDIPGLTHHALVKNWGEDCLLRWSDVHCRRAKELRTGILVFGMNTCA
jgi:hypothetical protein